MRREYEHKYDYELIFDAPLISDSIDLISGIVAQGSNGSFSAQYGLSYNAVQSGNFRLWDLSNTDFADKLHSRAFVTVEFTIRPLSYYSSSPSANNYTYPVYFGSQSGNSYTTKRIASISNSVETAINYAAINNDYNFTIIFKDGIREYFKNGNYGIADTAYNAEADLATYSTQQLNNVGMFGRIYTAGGAGTGYIKNLKIYSGRKEPV
jgi:hypothetical protein